MMMPGDCLKIAVMMSCDRQVMMAMVPFAECGRDDDDDAVELMTMPCNFHVTITIMIMCRLLFGSAVARCFHLPLSLAAEASSRPLKLSLRAAVVAAVVFAVVAFYSHLLLLLCALALCCCLVFMILVVCCGLQRHCDDSVLQCSSR